MAARRRWRDRVPREQARRPGSSARRPPVGERGPRRGWKHARVDGFVSLGVVASAIVVALGAQIADPIIGLVITLVILHITWESWHTVRSAEIDLEHIDDHHRHGHEHD